MDLRIGCTGWSYQGWVGPFYPRSMAASGYLRHYSSVFDITEINSTFYRIPTQVMAKKWFDDTPEGFMFTAKLPRAITHEGRLLPGPYLDQFLTSIKPLGRKMVAIVIQLPSSLPFSEAKTRLDKMASHLPSYYRYVVEGRHPSWFSEESYSFLNERNLSLAWSEVEGVKNPAHITSDLVYLRLIGDRSIHESEFGVVRRNMSRLVQKWAERLEAVRCRTSLAVAVVNNRFEGFAPATANKMRAYMNLSPAIWADRSQRLLGDFGAGKAVRQSDAWQIEEL